MGPVGLEASVRIPFFGIIHTRSMPELKHILL